MKMYSAAFNTMAELESFVNSKGLKKDQILNIFPSNGNYFLNYYAEE